MNTGTKKIITGLLVIPLMAIGVVTTLQVSSVNATDMTLESGLSSSQGEGVPTELVGANGMFNTVVNILLFIIGAVSVIMLIYGGIRYTTSGGNSNNVTAAKNTIMYSVIGLVIAILAYALVNFVIVQLME